MANGEHVDLRLLAPVDAEHLVDLVVHEGADAAGTKAEGHGCEVPVLAQVPGLEQAVAVAPILILRPHALDHLREEDHRAAFTKKLLADALLDDILTNISRPHELELVISHRIVVDAALDALDVMDCHIRLDRVERS